jgi:histidinol-phosphate/aromatic aminotransferase/cobyric acid decarboxylase-like protein
MKLESSLFSKSRPRKESVGERFKVSPPSNVDREEIYRIRHEVYLCAGAHQLEGLRAVTPPWAVTLPAQLAATVALKEPAYYEARYAETRVLRERLGEELEATGWEVVPAIANFLLAHLPENGMSAERLVQECRRRGLFLRNAGLMGSQMGSRAIRVAVKDAATNARIVRIIEDVHQADGERE